MTDPQEVERLAQGLHAAISTSDLDPYDPGLQFDVVEAAQKYLTATSNLAARVAELEQERDALIEKCAAELDKMADRAFQERERIPCHVVLKRDQKEWQGWAFHHGAAAIRALVKG